MRRKSIILALLCACMFAVAMSASGAAAIPADNASEEAGDAPGADVVEIINELQEANETDQISDEVLEEILENVASENVSAVLEELDIELPEEVGDAGPPEESNAPDNAGPPAGFGPSFVR